MMNLNEVSKQLENMGYETKVASIIKNGIEMPCISVKQTDNVSVCLYEKNIKGKTLDEIIEMCKRNLTFNPTEITPEFVLNNVMIGVQANGTENLIKRKTNFDGIEKYLYVNVTDELSFKLKENDFKELDRNDLWKKAEDNTYNSAMIMTIEDFMDGNKGELISNAVSANPYFTVVKNETCFRGAGIITIKRVVDKLKSLMNAKEMFVIPSSIHECIVMRKEDGMDINDIKEMVLSVNANEVSDEDKLIDNAYII